MIRLIHANDVVQAVDHERWRTCSRRFLDHNYQHTWAYADALARRRHATSEHVEIVSEGETLGLASVRIRSLSLLGGGVAYITGGPLTRMGRDDDIDRLGRCLDLLEREYVSRRRLVLRVLAPLGSPEWNAKATAAFEQAGWIRAARGRSYRTLLLDLSGPLDQVKAGCSKYWRRNLRRSERESFVVRVGTTRELLDPIRDLHLRLLARKRFRVSLDAEFYAGLQERLADDERFLASLVELDGEPVAGLMVSLLGDTCIPVILATDETGRRGYAAYLLQWHSIITARERGARYYDLGGIDPDRNVGVYNFKKGMRGLDMCAPGPFERTPRGIKGALIRGAEGVYWRVVSAPRAKELIRG